MLKFYGFYFSIFIPFFLGVLNSLISSSLPYILPFSASFFLQIGIAFLLSIFSCNSCHWCFLRIAFLEFAGQFVLFFFFATHLSTLDALFWQIPVIGDFTCISQKSLIHLIFLIWYSVLDSHHDKCYVLYHCM